MEYSYHRFHTMGMEEEMTRTSLATNQQEKKKKRVSLHSSYGQMELLKELINDLPVVVGVTGIISKSIFIA
jgi:hypothetical protein